MISSLLAFTLRLVLLAAMTFLFVVLFEHGPSNYLENVQADFSRLLEIAKLRSWPAPAAPEKSPNSGT